MTIYVLHLSPPYKHASHYIGFTTEYYPDRRVLEHAKALKSGSPLIRAAMKAGCSIQVAYVFHGDNADRNFERRLKNRKDVANWCPCCGRGTRPIPRVPNVNERAAEDRVESMMQELYG